MPPCAVQVSAAGGGHDSSQIARSLPPPKGREPDPNGWLARMMRRGFRVTNDDVGRVDLLSALGRAGLGRKPRAAMNGLSVTRCWARAFRSPAATARAGTGPATTVGLMAKHLGPSRMERRQDRIACVARAQAGKARQALHPSRAQTAKGRALDRAMVRGDTRHLALSQPTCACEGPPPSANPPSLPSCLKCALP